jgi:transposase
MQSARSVQWLTLHGEKRWSLATAASEQDVRLEVVKLPEAKKGFVLLPRRWVVERSFGWMSRFCRLVRDYECLAETLARLSPDFICDVNGQTVC